MKKNQSYFENLDIMRFVAAYLVLVSHVELTMGLMGVPNNWSNPWEKLNQSGEVNLWRACGGDLRELFYAFSHEMGAMSVVFFFVLSGFLITTLLLKEKELTGRIDVKRFYVRRVLRIWPLYFVVVILGLYALPHLGDAFYVRYQSPNLAQDWRILDLPYLLILPNLSNGLMEGSFPPNIGHAWSIGVEEQFYLFWPWFFLLSKAKPKWLVTFIAFVVLIKFIALHLSWPRWLQVFLVTMKFESMAIGGVGAYFFYHGKTQMIPCKYWRLIGVFGLIAVLMTFWFCPGSIQDALFLIQSGFFLVVIYAGVHLSNKNSNRISKLMVWLGQRSYGIYMWHMMFITLSVSIFSKMDESAVSFTGVLLLSSILTLVVSHMSYQFLEKPFLRLKKKYQET